MSLRPTVTEQSARDPSAAGPFFAIFVFPVSNVARATLAPGSKFNTTC